MIEGLLHFLLIVIKEFIELIFEIIGEWLSSFFENISYYSKWKKDEELVLGRIHILGKEKWFEPYKVYSTEIARRKSIRKLILKINMTSILSSEEKRNEFLRVLDHQLFKLNRKKISKKKTSHM